MISTAFDCRLLTGFVCVCLCWVHCVCESVEIVEHAQTHTQTHTDAYPILIVCLARCFRALPMEYTTRNHNDNSNLQSQLFQKIESGNRRHFSCFRLTSPWQSDRK